MLLASFVGFRRCCIRERRTIQWAESCSWMAHVWSEPRGVGAPGPLAAQGAERRVASGRNRILRQSE